MIDIASFRRRFAALFSIVAIGVAASGCCSRDRLIESFEWPEDVECPSPDVAAFYMVNYVGPDECGTHIVWVEGPPERTEDGCAYPIVVERCPCNNHF